MNILPDRAQLEALLRAVQEMADHDRRDDRHYETDVDVRSAQRFLKEGVLRKERLPGF